MTPPPGSGATAGVAAAVPAPAPARREPQADLRVVPRRQRRGWQVGTVAGALLFVALFAVAGLQALIASHQKHLDEVTERIATEEARSTALEVRLSELKSPERILGEATTRLGMMAGAPPAYLRPQADDDARAGEVPELTPPIIAAPASTTPPTTAPRTSTPTTVAGAAR